MKPAVPARSQRRFSLPGGDRTPRCGWGQGAGGDTGRAHQPVIHADAVPCQLGREYGKTTGTVCQASGLRHRASGETPDAGLRALRDLRVEIREPTGESPRWRLGLFFGSEAKLGCLGSRLGDPTYLCTSSLPLFVSTCERNAERTPCFRRGLCFCHSVTSSLRHILTRHFVTSSLRHFPTPLGVAGAPRCRRCCRCGR